MIVVAGSSARHMTIRLASVFKTGYPRFIPIQSQFFLTPPGGGTRGCT
jgi:hypothetical protein